MIELKPCPFCGGENFTRSVNGGILPSYLSQKEETRLYLNYKYQMSADLWCDRCGAHIAEYVVSNENRDNLYDEVLEKLYNKWNERSNNV